MRNCTSSLLHPHKLNSNTPKSKHSAKMLIHTTEKPVAPTNKLKPPRRAYWKPLKRIIRSPRLIRRKTQPDTMSREKLSHLTVLIRSPVKNGIANIRNGTDEVVSKPVGISSLGRFHLFCQSKTVPSISGNMLL